MNEIKIKDCKCGKKPQVISVRFRDKEWTANWTIWCCDKRVSGDTRSDAVMKWNRRMR
jgi:hypothetical protein